MNDIEKIREYRLLALRRVYKSTGGNLQLGFYTYSIFQDFPVDVSNVEQQKVIAYLTRKGFIEQKTKDGYCELTVDGLEFIEDELLSEQYLTDEELKTFDNKLDIILEKLSKLEHGQEIIFEEIEELRIKSRTFNKSDFKKLVIGSAFSMTANELITSETVRELVQTLWDSSKLMFLK
ncbi:hypothetical protein HZR84_09855 [Hyphobacterium sp. CCMP332]|nr:hypothetical protein HZR84_09855 [Hyphobacterium sp. CCMP332]